MKLCGPKTLLPHAVKSLNVPVYSDLDEAVRGVDCVMCLRLQFERMAAGLLPDVREYSRRYCMTLERLAKAAKNALVMHPGPINRGYEIASDLADAGQSLILDQVASGVDVRMAILHLYITRKER